MKETKSLKEAVGFSSMKNKQGKTKRVYLKQVCTGN